jgi:carbon storage regulator
MFMVSRRVGERIVIGGVIHIEIAKITRGGVRLAITAPKDQAVVRGEVYEAIAQANRDAATLTVDDADLAAALVRAEPAAESPK